MLPVPPKSTGQQYSATEFTDGVSQESQNFVASTGLALNGGDLTQMEQAALRYVSNGTEYSDGGTANNYLLTPVVSGFQVPDYFDGLIVRFHANATNSTGSGASTVNVNSLGVKDIVRLDGSALQIYDIQQLQYTTLRYDLAADHFIMISPDPVITLKFAYYCVTHTVVVGSSPNRVIYTKNLVTGDAVLVSTPPQITQYQGQVWRVTLPSKNYDLTVTPPVLPWRPRLTGTLDGMNQAPSIKALPCAFTPFNVSGIGTMTYTDVAVFSPPGSGHNGSGAGGFYLEVY